MQRIHISSYIFLTFLFWFISNFIVFTHMSGGPTPLMSYLAFLLFCAFVVTIRVATDAPLFQAGEFEKIQPLAFWLIGFLVWTAICFFTSSQSDIALQRLVSQTEMALLLAGFAYFMMADRLHAPIGIVAVVVLLLGSAFNIFDFVYPTFSTVPGRAAGLYYNPTISGFLLNLTTIIAVARCAVWLRWPLLMIAGIAIFLTFSRASWLLFLFTLLWLSWYGYLGRRTVRHFLTFASFPAAGLIAYALFSGVLAEFVSTTALLPYLDTNTLARIGSSAFATDFSAQERSQAFQFALETFGASSNPLLGEGLGHTREWDFPVSTHNMYLLFLVEGGLVGLGLYLWLMWIVWRAGDGLGRLLALQIIVFGLFTHNLLDSPARLIFIAAIFGGIGGAVRTVPVSSPKAVLA